MLHHYIAIWFGWVRDGGYLGIIALMAMESSILPVPSEIVIPPAVIWAAQGKMTFWGIVAAGTFGSWLGSALSYWLALWIGRAAIVKWGKFVLITESKLEHAEHMVHRYEVGGVFFSRLLPVIRHLISIPAGIIKMGFGVFSAATVSGAFLWCTVLAWFGSKIAQDQPDLINDPDNLLHAVKHESLPIVGAVLVLGALYLIGMRVTARRPAVSESTITEA